MFTDSSSEQKCETCQESLAVVSYSEYPGAKQWQEFYCANPNCAECAPHVRALAALETESQ